jgi:hypothetical protein
MPSCVPDAFVAAAHDWQLPLHAVSQQNPSTQLPDWHSGVRVHFPPLGCFFWHWLVASQYAVGAQSVSFVHEVAQPSALPGQVYGAQLGLPGLPAASWVHVPGIVVHESHFPLHAELQHTPPAQKPLAHSRQPID